MEYAADGDCTGSSIFDLASVTKLFTGLCLMRLKEEGLLDFGRSVFSYDSRFVHLRDVPVEQLAGFTVTLKTPVRLDECPDREEAEQALFAAAPAERPVRRVYSDIPSMILVPGDQITVCENSKKKAFFKDFAEVAEKRNCVGWLDRDVKSISGRVLRLPERAEIDGNITEQLIVEYYSR